MRAKPSESVSDLKPVEEGFQHLRDGLLKLGSAYRKRTFVDLARCLPDREKRWDRILRARDSITYRAESICWHLQVLYGRRESVRKSFEDIGTALKALNEPPALWVYRNHQFFLFDDVIFNTVSMFDYVARLTNALHMEERKLQWATLARDSEILRTLPSSLVGTIKREDRWLSRLNDYRSHLIHTENVLGASTGRMQIRRDSFELNWHVWVPLELQGKLPDILGRVSKEKRIDVVEGAVALTLKSLQSATTIVNSLKETYPWFQPGSNGP